MFKREWIFLFCIFLARTYGNRTGFCVYCDTPSQLQGEKRPKDITKDITKVYFSPLVSMVDKLFPFVVCSRFVGPFWRCLLHRATFCSSFSLISFEFTAPCSSDILNSLFKCGKNCLFRLLFLTFHFFVHVKNTSMSFIRMRHCSRCPD